MSDKPKVYVAGVGMITPVGFDAASTAAAVRAGISGFAESDYYNKKFEKMKLALMPDDTLPPLHQELKKVTLTGRQKRILQLASIALSEVFDVYPGKDPLPLFISLPENLPNLPQAIQQNFLQHLQLQSGVNLDLAMTRMNTTGRAGGIAVIDLAFKYLSATDKDFVLVGGVDSPLDLLLLSTLDQQDRVAASTTMDGYVPGEAATFLLLGTDRGIKRFGMKSLSVLSPPGLALEKGHRYSDETYKGDGLDSAFKLALSTCEGDKVATIYASLNGENFGAKELGVAMLRNKAALSEGTKVEHPADCIGDIGAAFGTTMIALATLGLAKNRSVGPTLAYCSSDGAPRAAICVNAAS